MESFHLHCSSTGAALHRRRGPLEILQFLYFHGAFHAAWRDMLHALGITVLLNVSSECPNHMQGCYQYKRIWWKTTTSPTWAPGSWKPWSRTVR
ncbi:Hypothetical predicted protein [Marmota monax]|uniref:Uncharacterized protein n=1 Tax=Marmota monax TaxID=9995 RepID=A0A5E4CJX8_MARMO|nr:hypothetical protein GHT09_017844 [Marmota monax]VTJ82146.1 Hypothetical predicted protein [Marmota monax]